MKRFVPLALIVLALVALPDAFADNGGSGSAPARVRIETVRLRLQLAQLRFALHCRNDHSDRCMAFAQKVEAHLTKLDDAVKAKLDELKACTADSTDATCKNADKKIAVLTRLDERLQRAIVNVQQWLSGAAPTAASGG